MTVPDSVNATSDDRPLKEFAALIARYEGALKTEHIPEIARALSDMVPNGRYLRIGRDGEGPVCVLARDLDELLHGFEHVVVVYTYVNQKGDHRMDIEQFLQTYKFFAPDCA